MTTVDWPVTSDSLVVCGRLVLWVEFGGLLHEVVTLVLQLLPHSHLPRVQPLPVVAVDWFRGGRSGGREGGREEGSEEGGREGGREEGRGGGRGGREGRDM